MKTILLKVFTDTIVPMLQKTAKDAADLKAKAAAFLGETQIVDDAGNPVEIDAVILQPAAADTDSVASPDADATGKAIADAVAKAMEPVVKSIEKRLPNITGGDARNDLKDTTAGFKNMGEFAQGVARWTTGRAHDPRLKAMITKAPTNYGTTQVGADGGFAVPDDFNAEIMRHVFEVGTLAGRCTRIPVSGNTLNIPTDQKAPWASTGIQAYWTGEGVTITTSKPDLGQTDVKLHKLSALVPVTNELLEDSPVSMQAWLNAKAPEQIAWKIDLAIVNGNGGNQPLGFRNSGALKQFTRVTGTGVAAAEVAGLLGALVASSFSSAGTVYLMHPTCIPAIVQATTGNFPIFIPNADATANGIPGRMYGIPAIVHQAQQASDNAGDLSLVDLKQYILLTKSDGGARSEVSTHLYFDYAMTAFRFEFRVGGQPWCSSTITDANGGGTQSYFNEVGAT